MKRADANKDGKLSLDELTAAADAVFTEADKEKKGLLEESGVGAAISPLFAPRPGFGPPGPRAPGPKVEPISGTTLMN
jgi:hypothetical protein